MKDYLHLLLGIACIGWCSLAWPENSHDKSTLEVQIIGLPQKPLKNNLLRISDKQKLFKNNFTPSTIRRFYRDLPKEIKLAIQPYGYFKPKIHTYLKRKNHSWLAHFNVNPGPQMKFTTLDLKVSGAGSTDRAFQRFYQRFPVKPGDAFNSQQYENAKQGLFDIASAHGYFQAKMIKSIIVVNLDTYQSHVTIHFETGPRYLFGATTFSHSPFNIHFLNRFLRYHQGNYFSQRKIQQTRNDLANSNYFQQVIITPKPKKAVKLAVPVKIKITPQLRKQYTFGLGFGSDTGPRALIGIDYRWVNQWGHRFNSFLRASQKNSELVANYYIPGHRPATDQYIITAGLLDQDQITGRGRSARAILGYQTQFLGFQHSFSLTYLLERYNLRGLPRTNTELLYPTYTLQRIQRNDAMRPTRGYSLVGRINGADRSVLSKTSFIQSRLDVKFLFTLFKSTRFIFRSTIGHTDIKDIVSLPLSLQFFAGGAESIRGFGYNSIGPGRNIFIGSAEIQQRIFGNIYLAAFFDFGNVSNRVFHDPFHEGVGPGIAWVSPIGMLEVTVANAISQPNKPWVIQFSMGPVI